MPRVSRLLTRLGVVAALAVLAACANSPTTPSCTYALTPRSQDVTASGGSFQAILTTEAACSWSATVDASWVTIETARGTGSGAIAFRVAAHDGTSPRAAALTVQGQSLEIRQDVQSPGAECSFGVTPSSVSFAASGGGAPLAVTAPAGCRWTASTRDSWISLAGAAGQGNGPMIVSVPANPGGPRIGSIEVGGQTVIVIQASVGCDFDVAPTSRSVGAAGGRFDVAIETSSACDWQAEAVDAWLSISASRGTGSAQVTIDVARYTGTSARTGTVRVAGQSVTVTQSPVTACSYVVSPRTQSAPAGGGALTVGVTTAANCPWTASSSAPWVTISFGQSGTGSALVGLLVAANTLTTARTAVVQIGDDAVTITQPGAAPACSYSVSPATQAVPITGGRFTAAVSTTAGCQWTAVSNVPWLTIVAGAQGSGSGAVGYSVAANTTQVVRTATLTIGGRTVAVTQADR